MPAPYQEFPLAITVLAFIAVAALLIIIALLFRINARIAALSANLSRQSRAAKPEEPDAVEIGPGTHFEEFLKEDAERRALPKKEQFKAYRQWRSEKGLNWSAKD